MAGEVCGFFTWFENELIIHLIVSLVLAKIPNIVIMKKHSPINVNINKTII